MYCNYYRCIVSDYKLPLDSNLHSPPRQLIELQMGHADLNASIDRLTQAAGSLPADQKPDELLMRRLKKRRLALRDHIAQLQSTIDGKEPA